MLELEAGEAGVLLQANSGCDTSQSCHVLGLLQSY